MARLIWWRQGPPVAAGGDSDSERGALPANPEVVRDGRRWFNSRRGRAARERLLRAEELEAERRAGQDAGVEAGLAARAEWLAAWRDAGMEPLPLSHDAATRVPRPTGPGRWGSVQEANLEGRRPGRWTDIAAANQDRPPRR